MPDCQFEVSDKYTFVKYEKPYLFKDSDEQKPNIERTNLQKLATTSNLLVERTFDTREVLDAVLPPRTWKFEGKLWQAHVSKKSVSITELKHLTTIVENRLRDSGAKQDGYCNIRKALYDDLLDEIVRQVTVKCVEQGILLARVRDELREQSDEYERLIESAMNYGFRTQIPILELLDQIEEEMPKLNQRENDLLKFLENKEKELTELELNQQKQLENIEEKLKEQYFIQENLNNRHQNELFIDFISDRRKSRVIVKERL